MDFLLQLSCAPDSHLNVNRPDGLMNGDGTALRESKQTQRLAITYGVRQRY